MAATDAPTTPPAWADFVHTGPDTLAGRYMRSFWQPVYVAKDLPLSKARPARIMAQDLTVYRGERGEPHVVGPSCAHRGTQLSIGWVEGDAIRCRYHGWVYDPTGQCVEQPGEPEPFCQRIHVAGYPTQEYLGLVFAYLGEGEPPELPRFPDFEKHGVLDCWSQLHGCNFFNAIDNDPIHVYFVHRSPGRDWTRWTGEVPVVWGEETAYGMQQNVLRPGGAVDSLMRGMPNISFRPRKDYLEPADLGPTDHLQWRVPKDDDSHIVFTANLIHLTPDEVEERRRQRDPNSIEDGVSTIDIAEQILGGLMDLDELPLPPGIRLTQVQDEATQMGQGRIPNRHTEHLGRTDGAVVAYRQLWMRELRNLAEGRPIKRWIAPSIAEHGAPAPADHAPWSGVVRG
jgi:5,5'-dehydrodivanillate O-demethylase